LSTSHPQTFYIAVKSSIQKIKEVSESVQVSPLSLDSYTVFQWNQEREANPMRANILRARPEMHEALPISEIEAEISINDAINQATLWHKEHQKESGSKRDGRKGKINNLLPGAGLEPARTLPGPRDFKSRVSTNSTIRA
jgi:hypothetical protein